MRLEGIIFERVISTDACFKETGGWRRNRGKGETRLSVVIVITTEAAYQLIRRGGVGGSGGLEHCSNRTTTIDRMVRRVKI